MSGRDEDPAASAQAPKAKRSFRDTRELEQLPARIEQLETEIARRGAAMNDPAFFRQDADDPEKVEARTEEYRKRFANPFVAASRGFIDDVIMPHGTRRRICGALKLLENKKLEDPWRKHDNMPL